MTHKAVILARGLGTRMQRAGAGPSGLSEEARRLASSGVKALIPVQGRPFLDYVVGSFLRAGIRELCLVVAPDAQAFQDYVDRIGHRTAARITCAVQPEPRGTADAVLAAEEFVGDDAFILSNCDNLYPQDALRHLASLQDGCCYAVAFDADDLVRESNIPADRIAAFAVMLVGEGGELRELVEKPENPERYRRGGRLQLSMNLFRFTPEVFDACRRIEPHPTRGELELTSAVSLMLREGTVPFKVLPACGGVVDLTVPADVVAAEKLLRGREPGF